MAAGIDIIAKHNIFDEGTHRAGTHGVRIADRDGELLRSSSV